MVVAGEFAVMVAADGDGGLLQVSHSAVVAESFPGTEDFLFAGMCHFFDGGKFSEKLGEEIFTEYGSDLSLLEHDF